MRGLVRCAVVAALILVATPVHAGKHPTTSNTMLYLQSPGTPMSKKVTLSASAADTMEAIDRQTGTWADSLGMMTHMWFEWTPTSSGTSPTLKLYFYGNTQLNGRDTLNTTPDDSVLVQAGAHCGDFPLNCAWRIIAKDGGGGGVLSYGAIIRPGWFQW